jgi:hypothetical protein
VKERDQHEILSLYLNNIPIIVARENECKANKDLKWWCQKMFRKKCDIHALTTKINCKEF